LFGADEAGAVFGATNGAEQDRVSSLGGGEGAIG